MNFNDVEHVVIGGVVAEDYPDFCDAFFSSAVCKETGKYLTDDELDELQNLFPDKVNELAHESLR